MKLALEVSKTDEELNQLNKEIDELTQQLKEKTGEDEIENLKLLHQLSENDISEYKSQIKILESELKLNSEILDNLKKENQNLKKSKNVENKDENKNKNNLDSNADVDLNKLLDSESNDNIIKKEIKKSVISKNILDECLNEKKEYEKLYEEIILKCNAFYDVSNKNKIKLEDYRNLIYKINNEIENLNKNFSIQYPNLNLNNPNNEKTLTKICTKVELASSALISFEEVYLDLKNFLNFENILTNIYNNFSKINKKEYYDEYSLKEILREINNLIQEIQTICLLTEEKIKDVNNKLEIIEKEINELKEIQNEYKNDNIKRNKSIKQSIRQSIRNQNKKINNNHDNKNINFNNIPLTQTLLINPKGSKEDLYKTIYLFNQDQEEEEIDSGDGQLIKKNWHEICYVYDDYDIHDIYYTLKAVCLYENSSFSKEYLYQYGIDEIKLLTLDGEKVPYNLDKYWITFNVNLRNLESAKVHLKFKQFKHKNSSQHEKLLNHYEYYGISSISNTINTIGKYILILKGSFDIIDFENEFLIKNTKNIDESEYIWGGLVPPGGKRTRVRFTRKKAKWNINYHRKIYEKDGDNISSFKYFIFLRFSGGNNKILNFKYTAPGSNNVYFDKSKNQYIASYSHRNTFEFDYNMIIENNSKPWWEFNYTDHRVRAEMPKEDIRDLPKLKQIATKIIQDFDAKHKNSEFEYHDFMKIAEWVYNNIKYNYAYVGKDEYTALDTYNHKQGVCHHFTRLSNALLYSLGYQVLYILGITIKNGIAVNDDGYHAWSAIKIKNKWYPFDATWGIYKGKVPITHIFCIASYEYNFYDYEASQYNVAFEKHSLKIKYLEEN